MLYDAVNLNKNHGLSRDLRLTDYFLNQLFCSFNQSANAACAKDFLRFLATFKYRNLLQIWFKLSVGRSQGKTAVMTKSSCLSTFFTFCHNKGSFHQ